MELRNRTVGCASKSNIFIMHKSQYSSQSHIKCPRYVTNHTVQVPYCCHKFMAMINCYKTKSSNTDMWTEDRETLQRHKYGESKSTGIITLVDLQLDAQNSYLFTYNTFIKILYMFRALPCSSSGGLRRNCIYICSLWYRHSLQVTVLCTG